MCVRERSCAFVGVRLGLCLFVNVFRCVRCVFVDLFAGVYVVVCMCGCLCVFVRVVVRVGLWLSVCTVVCGCVWSFA